MNKAVTGKLGELAAGRYLRENGYEIITANYRCRLGEIDIIAKQNNIYALLRLKRDLKIISTHLPTPLLFQKEKIIAAAKLYIASHNVDLQPRFDVAEVFVEKNQVAKINLITNAFDGEGK
ncbi:protein containing Uncharacterized protein family UPF0102 domain protein [human gut metagenome]|uniref:Protein containing Uncharacterized protein family UPF0102 domain protein n=1 Tax=human gut metagenome TaxID=408170 RepID=K1S4Q6_9ZZZZ